MNIGRYEVVKLLGEGGMASVHLAFDPYIKRQVAVKLLSSRFTHEPGFRDRFLREAQVIAALEQVYIVPVYDFGEHAAQPFLVMRYLPGGTLTERLEKGALSIPEVVPLLRNIASALDYAHKNGVVHRDIKPGNILFDSEGKAHLSDFGIAKVQEATAAFTGTGKLIGTPAYMSPEQARGEKSVDRRSDIYSLGVMLFQALSGELPFKSKTPMSVAMAHIHDPIPSLLALRPDLPAGIEDVIRKALDKNPEYRFQTAKELAEAVENQGRMVEKNPGTVLEPAPQTLVEQQPDTLISRSRPLAIPLPDQRSVPDIPSRPYIHAAPPVTVPKTSRFPRLVGAGVALLGIILCVGVLGGVLYGFTSNLFPNPFPSRASTEVPALQSTSGPASVGSSDTQEAGGEGAASTANPTDVPASTPNALSLVIADGKGIPMVLVPASEFTMGSGVPGADQDEKPVHVVTLGDYYIDKFEVTNAAYRACVEADACKPPIKEDSFTRSRYYGIPEYDEYPVVYVDWNMAKAYCEWRGARLPTEAEWEKAARGGGEQLYPWGTGIDCQKANYYGSNGCYGGTTRVGSYEEGKSPYEVYDMAGNVWEWVADWYSETYYQTSPTSDPSGPDSGQSRVLRGGSWNRQEFDVRVSNRSKYGPTYFNFDIGFRCASDVSP